MCRASTISLALFLLLPFVAPVLALEAGESLLFPESAPVGPKATRDPAPGSDQERGSLLESLREADFVEESLSAAERSGGAENLPSPSLHPEASLSQETVSLSVAQELASLERMEQVRFRLWEQEEYLVQEIEELRREEEAGENSHARGEWRTTEAPLAGIESGFSASLRALSWESGLRSSGLHGRAPLYRTPRLQRSDPVCSFEGNFFHRIKRPDDYHSLRNGYIPWLPVSRLLSLMDDFILSLPDFLFASLFFLFSTDSSYFVFLFHFEGTDPESLYSFFRRRARSAFPHAKLIKPIRKLSRLSGTASFRKVI